MIDLLAAGLALKNRLMITSNPQGIRSNSATDIPCPAIISAISAKSAVAVNQNSIYELNNNTVIDSQAFRMEQRAEIVDIAEKHVNQQFLSADILRNNSGLSMEQVACNDCEHFTADCIGNGAGIGKCELGIEWTQEYNGRKPLYRYAERQCLRFSKLMS